MKRAHYLPDGVVLRPDEDARRDELVRMPYEVYLQSPEWFVLRDGALTRAHHRCQGCNSGSYLEVHHRSYDAHPLGEVGADLTVLCSACHRAIHVVKDLRDGTIRVSRDRP